MKVLKNLSMLPFCLLGFTVYTPFRAIMRKNLKTKLKNGEIHRILLIGSSGIGDLILLTPLLKALNRLGTVDMLTHASPNLSLLKNRSLNRILCYPKRNLTFWEEVNYYLKHIRHLQYDLVLHTYLHRWLKTSLLSFFTGAPFRIGYNERFEGFLNTYTILLNRKDHIIDLNLKLIHPLKIEFSRSPEIVLTRMDLNFAEKFFHENGKLEKKPILGIHPGCLNANKAKRWMPERFSEIGDRFVEKYKGIVIFFEGPEDRLMVREIKRGMKRDPIIVSQLEICKIASIIKSCSLFLSNDSGLMHIASALNVPLIALFGPTSPARNGPLSKNSTVLYTGIPCSPCYQSPPILCKFEKRYCLDDIGTDTVFRKIEILLKENVWNLRHS